MFNGMPQSPNHPRYWHSLPRRHGDMMRADGGSAANDMIVLGTHVGTHIDALAHVSQDGRLHGGLDAGAASSGGRFQELGVETITPIVRRGVLLGYKTSYQGRSRRWMVSVVSLRHYADPINGFLLDMPGPRLFLSKLHEDQDDPD